MRVALQMLCSLCFVLCLPAQQPDWKPVGVVLGQAGSVLPDGTFRIDVPRRSRSCATSLVSWPRQPWC